MAVRLKDLAKVPERLSSEHRMCAGCGAPIAVRQIMMAVEDPVVVGCATGCLEVATTIYPYTAWRCSFIHSAFENSAATISGVETAYRALAKKGKVEGPVKFVAFGGDGGTYDIGLQSLSGVLERGHDMVYVCYDNQAYMNTGIRRSGATPMGASTTTSPAGSVVPGKTMHRKDLTAIVAAHNIPYAAQAAPNNWRDLVRKARKAFEVKGPAFLNVLAPCPRGWPYDPSKTIEMCELAVDTCFWPLYEVEDGEWRLTYKPKEKKPLADWLKLQGRFRHLFKGGRDDLIDELQADVDRRWNDLLKRCGEAG